MEQNLSKATETLCIFLMKKKNEVEKYVKMIQSISSDDYVHRYNIEILNLFDPELQLFNSKPIIKSKLKRLLTELKKFKVQSKLALDYKKKKFKC